MSTVENRIRLVSDGDSGPIYGFHCPGCNDVHHVATKLWEFNGDMRRPTFSPSLLVRSGHYAPGQRDGHCWCTYNAEHPNEEAPFNCYQCHSFVRDGQIEFLGDCTHWLAGQTIELPVIPADGL